jgi:hypothetical protein
MDNAELEKRLTVLQDIEAIKRLKAEYCDICDDAHNPDRMAAIFADDGIWEGKGLWRAQGHADIRKQAKDFAERKLLTTQRLQSPHRGERRRSARALDFPGTVHLSQWEPPGLARGLLRLRLCQGRRCVEISILSGPCPHDRALRRGVGLKSHRGRILQLAPTPPAVTRDGKQERRTE